MDDALITAISVAVRWAHLAACVLVVGACAAIVLAGRSERPTVRAWEASVVGRARWLLLAALGSGVAALAWQTALAEGRPGAAIEPAAVVRVALETTVGHAWLARHGLLLLLGAFLLVRADLAARIDWMAARGESLLLASASLAALATAGHAAAVEPATATAIAVDAVHLLAVGVWAGGLPPLARLLRAASTEAGADGRAHAVLAARRFSRVALPAVVVAAATGIVNATVHVGSVPGAVGTPYGRWLLVKLALLAPLLGLALVNRRRLLPALSGDAVTVGRPAMRRLATTVTVEAGLVLLLLAVVAAMVTTPPARHVAPTWPFSFRFALAALDGGDRGRALVGSQVALLGIVGIVAWLVTRARPRLLLAAAGGGVAVGLALALPPLAIDAYPTTYVRPAVPYHAASITTGAVVYRDHCAGCHGPAGRAGAATPLTEPRLARHTAGDLFWWISAGFAGRMPAFGARLSEEARWDLVNYLRALQAGQDVRALPAAVGPGAPLVIAPDFSFTVGPTPQRTLRDYRGSRIVLLVLYSLPASRPRLAELAEGQSLLGTVGVEVVLVPRDAAPDAIRRLGDAPRFFVPIVTEGAREIVAAYDLLGPAPHVEYLIDRQGYLRARWTSEGEREGSLSRLLADVQELNEEQAPAPPADEHVH